MQLFAAINEGWGELFERNAVYLRRRTTQSMKGALIGILFLLFSGWWGSGEEGYVRVEELQQEGMERVEAGKMDRQEGWVGGSLSPRSDAVCKAWVSQN